MPALFLSALGRVALAEPSAEQPSAPQPSAPQPSAPQPSAPDAALPEAEQESAAGDLDGQAASAPGGLRFRGSAHLLGGFEDDRKRPSGAQIDPGQQEYGFVLRQARLRFTAQQRPVRLHLTLDLADALDRDVAAYDSPPYLRTATLEYRFSRALRLVVGRFKRPFSRLELEYDSAVDLPVVRRGLFNHLVIENNQWGERAVGVLAKGRLRFAKLRWFLSLTNPSWSTSLDARGVDAIGRVSLALGAALSVGVNAGYKYLNFRGPAASSRSVAGGGDVCVQLGPARLLFEANMAELPFETGRPRALGALALADYLLPVTALWSLEPVLFVEFADANLKLAQTESMRFVFGLNLLGPSGFRILPQLARVRPIGTASASNPWLERDTFSLIFSEAL